MMRRACAKVALTILAVILCGLAGASSASAAFTPGNILASVGGGLVKEFTPEGALVNTYDTGTNSVTTGTVFDSSGNLFVTDFDGNDVSEFNPAGELLGSFGSGYNADPESIVLDSAGNAYVGQADGEHKVLKFNKAGELLGSYAPETESRGTDWLALASDDCTLYYTSEGHSIKRFNVCKNEQLSDFVDNLPGGEAYQLRFLPDGGLLVADANSILRLDKEGNTVTEYTTPSGQEWFNVQFTPGAWTFWAGDIATGNVAEFDLNSGTALAEFSSEPATELAGLTVIGSPDFALKDTDGDGIPDEWEEHGLRDSEGHMLLDLPTMGADPRHKDIFVQLDAMRHLALSHTALATVTKAFKDAPVANPDGTEGIHLHVDEGPSSVMNPVTGETWGSRSLANDDIPLKQTLGSVVNKEYDWSAFEQIKHESFIAAREAAFHYAISVDRYNGFSSGVSRGIPSSDFIVALGPACNPEASCPGTVKQQAGTFMHELGHNLGLEHGGQVDENYVPNYISVMNYTFQFSGLSTSPDGVDYSRYDSNAIPTLDELDLNEFGGFGVEPPIRAASQETSIWCANEKAWEVAPLDGPVDFNCNGLPFDSGVSADLHDGPAQPDPTYRTEGSLTSYDDWSSLWYRGGAIGGNGLGALLPEATEDDEASISTLNESSDRLVPPPSGSTGNATDITTSTATLHGQAIPNGEDTHAYFQYGSSTEYGTQSPSVDVGSANATVATSAALVGLAPGVTYHYQEVIETPTHLLYGADQTFTTQSSGGAPPTSTPVPTPTPAVQPPTTGVAGISGHRAPACVVPRLRGKTARKAASALRAAHCLLGRSAVAKAARHRRHGALVVVGQGKRPGLRLPNATKVAVVLGLPSPRRDKAKR
jgi:hypothetical protein